MAEYEDLIQRVRDAGLEDEADRFEQFSKSQLRKDAEGAKELRTENERLKGENRKLVVAPKKEAALRAAGVDTANLRPADRQVIGSLEFEGDEPSEDWVAKTIADLQLPIVEGQQQSTEPPNAAAVVRAATQAPSGGSTSPTGVTTPADAAKWSSEQAAKFSEEHPDAWEALKRGEEVTGVRTS
jgi:hypothetical protein